jgi:arginase family enzyme
MTTPARDRPGLGTLFASPQGLVEDLRPGDYAFFGVPYDLSSPGLLGARHGPAACRDGSGYYAVFRPSFEEITTARKLDFPLAIDLGDAPIRPLDWSTTDAILHEYIRSVLSAGAVPVAIGGDHLVTAPLAAGFGAHVRERGGEPAYVQFSRRLDLGGEHPILGQAWRGATATLVGGRGFDAGRMAWVGVNGYLPTDEWARVKDESLNVVTLEELRRDGVGDSVRRVLEAVGAAPRDTYVSVDLDVLDGAYVPHTDEPTFDGLTNVELLSAIDVLNETGVGAFDVTGLNPHPEPSAITGARFTAWLILRFICRQSPIELETADG